MIVTVTFNTSEGIASGINILSTISSGDAPIDTPASITPGLTSKIEPSTSLAKKGIAATTKGTMAAFVPIELPTTSLVKGIINIIKITKGIDLVIFIRIDKLL